MPSPDLLYPDTTAGRERALIGALSLRGHSPETIAVHRRRSSYLRTRDKLAAYLRSDPEPTPAERAALAAVLIGGLQ